MTGPSTGSALCDRCASETGFQRAFMAVLHERVRRIKRMTFCAAPCMPMAGSARPERLWAGQLSYMRMPRICVYNGNLMFSMEAP